MTGYNATYTTGDLSEITVDAIASGGVEAVNFAGLFVILAFLGVLATTIGVIKKKMAR